MHEENLIEVRNLKSIFLLKGLFGRKTEQLKAVDDLSNYKKGETFGLVGESGCGKSTTGKVSFAYTMSLQVTFYLTEKISQV